LISLRKATTDLERVESQRDSFAESFRTAILDSAECAIELDSKEARNFRECLQKLAAALKSASESASVEQVQGNFRGALHSYRDQAQSRIEHLRKEVEAGAAAVANFAGSIASNGSDHQAQMNAELEQLRRIGGWDDLAQIRLSLQGVISGIGEAMVQMQRANQMNIAQLRDEIRTLHHSLDSRRRVAATDAATGAWNRQKSAHRMQELLREDEAFRVLLISVTNFKRLEGRYTASAVETALKELTRRLREVVGAEPPIGRWSQNELLVILDVDAAGAMALSRESSLRLSGAYPHPGESALKPIQLEVATGLVERAPGGDGTAFLKKLDQLSSALAACSGDC
jgi:GGDEF domain-containing protein